MRKYSLLLIIIFIVSFQACNNELDINAPEEDIAVVYGILDVRDTIHYIKITKAFNGDESAYDMAQESSYSSYGDNLEVKVEEYDNDEIARTFTCTLTTISNKDSGIFYYPGQEVYAFTADLSSHNTYKLYIENKETGKIITSETNLITNFYVYKPYWNPATREIGFVANNGKYVSGLVELKSVENARLYQILYRFNYRELDLETNDTIDKYIEWKLNDCKTSRLDGGEKLTSNYNTETFFSLLGSKIETDFNKVRFAGTLDLEVTACGDPLCTYMDLNKPSNTIIQQRPSYTNVTNGIGIFSCRHSAKYSFYLNAFSTYELLYGQYTSDLNFQ